MAAVDLHSGLAGHNRADAPDDGDLSTNPPPLPGKRGLAEEANDCGPLCPTLLRVPRPSTEENSLTRPMPPTRVPQRSGPEPVPPPLPLAQKNGGLRLKRDPPPQHFTTRGQTVQTPEFEIQADSAIVQVVPSS